jgi:hypothetical protein
VELDDIECNLDEDLDNEHYDAKNTNKDTSGVGGQRRQSNIINDSFILQRIRDFSPNVVTPASGIPHPTSQRVAPGVRGTQQN